MRLSELVPGDIIFLKEANLKSFVESLKIGDCCLCVAKQRNYDNIVDSFRFLTAKGMTNTLRIVKT